MLSPPCAFFVLPIHACMLMLKSGKRNPVSDRGKFLGCCSSSSNNNNSNNNNNNNNTSSSSNSNNNNSNNNNTSSSSSNNNNTSNNHRSRHLLNLRLIRCRCGMRLGFPPRPRFNIRRRTQVLSCHPRLRLRVLLHQIYRAPMSVPPFRLRLPIRHLHLLSSRNNRRSSKDRRETDSLLTCIITP